MSRTFRTVAFLSLAAAGLACAPSERGLTLPDINLPTLSSKIAPSLAECPTPKCLTVYLSPWCGYCRQATPNIIVLRKYLEKNNVTTRIIIGMDQPAPIQEYAEVFGRDTLLDINDSFPVKGVPHFFVSDETGKILKDVGGYPMGLNAPGDLASYFGLP